MTLKPWTARGLLQDKLQDDRYKHLGSEDKDSDE